MQDLRDTISGRRWRTLGEALLVVVAVGVVYGFTLGYPFHFDDHPFIVNNPVFHRPISLLAVCTYLPTRAVANLSFALNALIGGVGNPAGFRLVNILIHMGASLIVWRLAWLTSRTPALRGRPLPCWAGAAALCSALIFAVHPVQTQAITYIYQRVASLAAFWYLAAVWLYAESRLSSGPRRVMAWRAGSLLAATLGMFTKEVCVTLPLAVAAYEVFFFESGWRGVLRRGWAYALLFPIIPATLLAGTSPMARAMATIAEDEASIPRLHYLITQSRVLVTYLRLLLLPVAQNVDYDYPVARTLLAPGIMGSVLLLGALVLSVPLLYRRQRLAAFGVTWFFLTLAVESSVIPLHNVIFEHRLYLPLAGFALVVPTALAAACRKARSAQRLCPVLMAAVVVAFGAAAMLRNTAWSSSVALWDDAVAKSPDKARPYVNRGVGWLEFGRSAEALADLTRALELNPNSAYALNNRGTAWEALGRADRALDDYNAALALIPNYADALFNRGNALMHLDRTGAALPDFDAALKLSPHRADIRVNCGAALLQLGRIDEAIAMLGTALRIDPNHPTAYLNRSMAHALAGNADAAWRDVARAKAAGVDTQELETVIAAILRAGE